MTDEDPVTRVPINRLLAIWLTAFGIYYLVTVVLPEPAQEIAYSQFVQQLQAGEVASVRFKGRDLQGQYRGGADSDTAASSFHVVIPELEGEHLLRLLDDSEVVVKVAADQPAFWVQLLSGFAPWILIIGLFWWSSRALKGRLGGGGLGGSYGFGKSRARRHAADETGVGFADVAGLETAKKDLLVIVDYLKNPDKYRSLGAEMPRGVLMMGAPGTGKTLLAKACAHEAGVPFFSVSGSEFIEMFVGVGASRVRDMFASARQESPALIFIDEIDSVGRVRGTGLGGGNDEREQTLNQILAEMDGFESDEAIVVLAATNRPDVLDPALLRPGRFDRKVTLELPQREARELILQVHCRNKPLADDVRLAEIAASSVGFSGADLANIVNEAALNAARSDRSTIAHADFLIARDNVLMGAPRADMINLSERERIAWHESGHAIAAWYVAASDPLEKISIVPRGRALGMTEQVPVEDRHNITEDFLLARLAILLAGRVAEKRQFGNYSTGAEDDLKQATRLAYKMVGQWGMGEQLGAVGYSIAEEHPFLGRELSTPREFGDATAALIDTEVRAILARAEQTVIDLLQTRSAELAALVTALLERETLDHADIEAVLAEVVAPRPDSG
jgi:cell division protease FtsH